MRSVAGVVFRKNRVIEFLILHRKLNWAGWEMPKGGVEQNENEEEALLREIEEETGLDNVEIVANLNYINSYVKDGKVVQQSVFLAKANHDDVKLSREHDDYRWVSFEEALKSLTHENQKKALKIAKDVLDGNKK